MRFTRTICSKYRNIVSKVSEADAGCSQALTTELIVGSPRAHAGSCSVRGALYPEPAYGAYNAIKEARLRLIERSAMSYAWAQVSSSLDVFGQDLFSKELRWRFETLCPGSGLESIKNLLFHRGRLHP